VIVLCARYNGKISKSVWDHIIEKIFDAKLDLDIESPSHETHLTPSPPHAFLEVDLENFRPQLCTETLFESELL